MDLLQEHNRYASVFSSSGAFWWSVYVDEILDANPVSDQTA